MGVELTVRGTLGPKVATGRGWVIHQHCHKDRVHQTDQMLMAVAILIILALVTAPFPLITAVLAPSHGHT